MLSYINSISWFFRQFSVKQNLPEMGTRTVQVKRTQFSLTPAYACSAYKVQGKTLNKVIRQLENWIEHMLMWLYRE